jgi:uncharacterized lipoprotein YbaY/heat shock protein HslJ
MRILLAGLLAALATACTDRTPAIETPEANAMSPTGTISGTVSYRERIALTNRAVLEISLQDVSRQDVAAEIIAEKTIDDPGQVPIAFELDFPADAIDPRRAYALRARITDGGRLQFTTDTAVPVLTRGAGHDVHPTLVRVGQAAPGSPTADSDKPGAHLSGMFQYMADAAMFRDCRTNKRFPVAMEGAYIEAERAYLNSGIEPGSEVLLSLTGRYLERPKMEGEGNEIKLIVDSIDKIHPEETCAPPARAELTGTYWKLTSVGGEHVETPEGGREAHLVLEAAEHRVRGHGGCNSFFGGFETGDESSLRFGGVGSTMMACAEGMDTERAFLDALGETTRYEIRGETLSLFADDRLLARFEAVYF